MLLPAGWMPLYLGIWDLVLLQTRYLSDPVDYTVASMGCHRHPLPVPDTYPRPGKGAR
jgi:hypothetical protein